MNKEITGFIFPQLLSFPKAHKPLVQRDIAISEGLFSSI